MRTVLVLLCLLVARIATATPAILRSGANHHLGDDSFVARFGRPPTPRDSEKLRMAVHLEYVHAWLAARPATAPSLEARRHELLGYLADYRAAGITPVNDYVARRNPVFIDRAGRICAVGYLIERSVGRDVAEAIADAHRLDYLEDIAAARPEVRAWIATSGFTLDELASIQPGYEGPAVQHEAGWQFGKVDAEWQAPQGLARPADGVFRDEATGILGTFRGGQMVGAWTRTVAGVVRGKGTFARGAGTWTSFRADGSKLAEGPFVNSHAHGAWRIYHPSGRLAATGTMRRGRRDGNWTFFHDDAAQTVLSRGSFSLGQTDGGWKHYDTKGVLIATSSGSAWVGLTLDVEPGADGVRREVHTGIPAEGYRLDGFYRGKDRLYVTSGGVIYDGEGRQLTVDGDTWTARPCTWSAKRREIARRGDATTLHELLIKHRHADPPVDECRAGAAQVLPAALAKRYATMLATRTVPKGTIPRFDVAGGGVSETTPDGDPQEDLDDYVGYLLRGMAWYVEWPHVDDTFRTVYATLPGYAP